MERLEEDLTCAVCYSLFSDPRVLPCSHTFCKTCLDTLLQVSSNYNIWRPLRQPLKCPSCRNVAELPPAGTGALPCNVSLKAIIEKYQRNGHPHGPLCEEHQQQPLNMYCVEDRKLICGLCLTVGHHQGHIIDDLQAAYIREKQTPQILAKLSEKKCLQVSTWREFCKILIEKRALSSVLPKARGITGQKKLAYLAVLDKICIEVAHAYDPLIYRVKEMQEEQLDLVTLGSALEDEDSALVFLDKVHVFKERVEEFIQTPLPSVLSLSVSPRAADYLHTHWPAVTISSLDEAPVPKISCCTRCHSKQHSVRPASWFHYVGPIVLVFLLIALWGYPLDGLLDFSQLSSIAQVVHSMSSELITSVWSSAELLVTQVQHSHLVTNGHQAFQQLFTFLKSLTCWFE
uniref:Tripartite motif containing 59 n=1 Tax=Neogobius melanostomus TaxID=47308 RepID=A0A8C6T294_9GOBI